MTNRNIYKITVKKDGMLHYEEQRISIVESEVEGILDELAIELVQQGHTGVIFIEQIKFGEWDQQTSYDMPQFTREFGERKIQ